MIFNGIEKDYIVPLTGRRRSAWAPISRNLTTVIGMPGALLSYTDVQVRVITVPVLVKAENIKDLQKVKEDMAEWLVHDEPKELIFKDEPDRVYYALVDGELELDEIFSTGRGEITFICPDPYKYGPEKVYQTDQDTFIIENEGTAPTKPIFELTVKEPVTFAMVSDGERYNMIGRPVNVVEETINTKNLLFREDGSTLNTWTSAGTQVDGGIVTGEMNTDGAGITVPDYGTGSAWHGPALIKEVTPVQDFEVSAHLQIRTTVVTQTARVEVYLFDENMNVLGKIALLDNNTKVYRKIGEARIGPFLQPYENYLISARNYQYNWDYWFGMLRITRVGNMFEFYITRIGTNNKHVYGIKQVYHDIENNYAGKLKYVQIHIGTYGTTGRAYSAKFFSVYAYELTQATEDQTPYIAYPGDVITFDHTTNELLLNGEDAKRLKDFGGEYFDLPKGYTALTILPEGAFDTKIRFKPRYR